MLDLMPSLGSWPPASSGLRCAVATVVRAGGSVPRPPGTSMLVSEAGDVLGSLSGGCIEGAVVEAALGVMRDGGRRVETFGYSAGDAFAAGLSCGGELEIHIEPLDQQSGLQLAGLQRLAGQDPSRGLALVRRVDGGGRGAVVVPDPGTFQVAQSAELAALLGWAGAGGGPDSGSGTRALMLGAAARLEPLLRGGRAGLVRLAPPDGCPGGTAGGTATGGGTVPGPVTLLVESRLPPARLLVVGANDFGAALLPGAKLLGYDVTVCDARPAFAGQARFAAADEVAIAWPHRYLAAEAAAGRIDARTAVCVLTHDPKFDIPLLETALGLDLAYVGAMGSRRSHRQRIDSLLAAGLSLAGLARLHSPIGLDLGAVTPAEVAVSITAELVSSRNRSRDAARAPNLSLRDRSGPIHQVVDTPPQGAPQRQEVPWT